MSGESISARLHNLAKGKKLVSGTIPTKAIGRHTLKPAFKYKSNKESMTAGDASNIQAVKQLNTHSMMQTKAKLRSTDKYVFQSEIQAPGCPSTLADSLVFLLCNLESVTELASVDDIYDILSTTPAGMPMHHFIDTVRSFTSGKDASASAMLSLSYGTDSMTTMTSVIDMMYASMQACVLDGSNDDCASIGDMAVDVVQSSRRDVECGGVVDGEVTGLLLGLLGVDVGVEGSEELLGMGDDQVKATLDEKGFESLFASQLVRLVMRDVKADLLPGNGDDVADGIVEKFTSLLVTKFRSQSENSSKLVGQQVHISKLQSSFTRYDFTNNFSIGILELGIDLIKSITRKNFHFILPNGKRITHKSQNSLTSVSIPGLSQDDDVNHDLAYPTVADAVSQIQGKETFAIADFDWICLNYNITLGCFEWLSRGQPLSSRCQEHCKSTYFIGFDHGRSVSLDVLKASIMVPLTNRPARCVSIMRLDNVNLYLSSRIDASVADLVSHLNTMLRAQKMIRDDVHVSDIKFESLTDARAVRPISGGQKVIDLLQQVGWLQTAHQNQLCTVICSYKIRHPNTDKEAQSGELVVEENRISSSQTLKASITSFMQLVFNEIISDNCIFVNGSCYLQGKPLEFWLPAILVVDVRKYAVSVLNSKDSLNLKALKDLVQQTGLSFNTRYAIKGLILSRTDNGAEDYLPVTVDIIKSLATEYYDGCHKSKLASIRDTDIRFAVFERSAVDIPTD